MKNIAHCNFVTKEYGVTVVDADLNNIEIRIVLTNELLTLSQIEPLSLYKKDQSGNVSVVKELSNLEINEISADFGSNYEAGAIQYYVKTTDYESEIINFNISKTLNSTSDEIYIDYANGVFEIKKVTSSGGGSGGGSGTGDYNELINKPKINSIELKNNKSFSDLGANALSNLEIENIINSVVL